MPKRRRKKSGAWFGKLVYCMLTGQKSKGRKAKGFGGR